MSDFIAITNHTSRVVVLPPVYGFEKGYKLVPGLNRVPARYLEELTSHEVPACDNVIAGRRVRVPARKPGAEVLAELQKNLWRPDSARHYRGVSGSYDGPQITVHADASVFDGRDEGPLAPDFLPQDEKLALAIIAHTSDRAALTRWQAFASDTTRAALARRLANLMAPTAAIGV